MSSRNKDYENILNSIILKPSPSTYKVNICEEAELEDFFKLERDGVCRYFLKN
jgi:hypothetical protein